MSGRDEVAMPRGAAPGLPGSARASDCFGSESMTSEKVVNRGRAGGRRLVWLTAAAVCLSAWAFANEDLLRLQQDPGQWAINNGNYAGWNYSPLDQINTSNVSSLQVAWTFQTGILDNHE